MEVEQPRPVNPAMTFDEVSMERSKSFVKALQVHFLTLCPCLCFFLIYLGLMIDLRPDLFLVPYCFICPPLLVFFLAINEIRASS